MRDSRKGQLACKALAVALCPRSPLPGGDQTFSSSTRLNSARAAPPASPHAPPPWTAATCAVTASASPGDPGLPPEIAFRRRLHGHAGNVDGHRAEVERLAAAHAGHRPLPAAISRRSAASGIAASSDPNSAASRLSKATMPVKAVPAWISYTVALIVSDRCPACCATGFSGSGSTAVSVRQYTSGPGPAWPAARPQAIALRSPPTACPASRSVTGLAPPCCPGSWPALGSGRSDASRHSTGCPSAVASRSPMRPPR